MSVPFTQPELVGSILLALDKLGVRAVEPHHMSAVVRAADDIIAALKPAPDPFHRDRPEVAPGPEWRELHTAVGRFALAPGDEVAVVMDDGARRAFTVAREPWRLGHGAPVIGLEGIAGGYALERVAAVRRTDRTEGCE